jgi:hypothetical protein
LAQVICGLLSYLVVENLHVTMHDASLASEFVIEMLAISSPGKMAHWNGTTSAAVSRARQMASANPAAGAIRRKQAGQNCIATAGFYLPAARRSASLIRSCQPGPPSWKYSSTS